VFVVQSTGNANQRAIPRRRSPKLDQDALGTQLISKNFFSQRAKFVANRNGKKSNQQLPQRVHKGLLNRHALPGIMSSDYVNRETAKPALEESSLMRQVTIKENGGAAHAADPSRTRANFKS
jgi:hypothetical protein